MKQLIIVFLFATCLCGVASAQSKEYDIVLAGGRVIDPETKLDTIKNVGIFNGHIAEISSEPLKGKENINVTGLVVCAGFIDLHVHGRNNIEQEYKLHDGVTTMLELEVGMEFLGKWYESRKSKALINYGASVNWAFERCRALNKYQKAMDELYQATISGQGRPFLKIDTSFDDSLSAGQVKEMIQNIRNTLAEGGIGIGVPIGYMPNVKPSEVFRLYQLAAELNVPIFTHVREAGITAIQQAIADAILTGAPLHIVHINSASLGQIRFAIELVQAAKNKGFDITTEMYPYTAGSTYLQTQYFNEGWQQRLGINYGDLQWVATGERLTKETFEKYRKEGGAVVIHSMKPEWIAYGLAAKGVIIASDGMPYAKLAHPRSAGTCARVLGKYVRDEKILDLNSAIEKMTLLPAKRLEGIAPMMRFKGRIQTGADADITVFNPNTVIDKANFEKGLAFSEGIEWVIVNGAIIVRNGKTVNNVFPGQPVYGKYKQ